MHLKSEYSLAIAHHAEDHLSPRDYPKANSHFCLLPAYSCINVPPILVRTVPAISVPNVPLAIFKEYWD